MAEFRLKMGDTLDINVATGANAPDFGITYELVGSSTALATISSAGVVTPTHPGLITVNAKNNAGTVLRTLLIEIVSVGQASFDTVADTGVYDVALEAVLSSPEVHPDISSQGYTVNNTTSNQSTSGVNTNPSIPRREGRSGGKKYGFNREG
jgi:hypothetical protein